MGAQKSEKQPNSEGFFITQFVLITDVNTNYRR